MGELLLRALHQLLLSIINYLQLLNRFSLTVGSIVSNAGVCVCVCHFKVIQITYANLILLILIQIRSIVNYNYK